MEQNNSSNNFSRNVLASWQAPEYEVYEKDRRWYLYMALVLIAIIAYATWTNSPLMAITFVLIGVVGYIFVNKEPRIIEFRISQDGIMAGRELYEFDSIKSFWIFYEPGELKVISLHMKSNIMPYVHIPIQDEDPVEIRDLLLEYIPEIKQDPSMVDTLERLLRI